MLVLRPFSVYDRKNSPRGTQQHRNSMRSRPGILIRQKRRFAPLRQLVFILCALCVLCGKTPAQDFKTIYDGVEYTQVGHKLGSDPVKINLLRLDLTKIRLDVHHAMDASLGTEKTSSIATRHGAVAAINAGFFRLDTSIFAGEAAGLLMIDRKLQSENKNGRISIIITNGPDKTVVNFAHLELGLMAVAKNSGVTEIYGINRDRLDDEVVIYTPEFGRSTLTKPDGIEVVVQREKVLAISRNGSNSIPSDGFVLSASGKEAEPMARLWRIGDRIRLVTTRPVSMLDERGEIEREKKRNERLSLVSDESVRQIEDLTNGVPQLIKGGKIDITWELEKAGRSFVETRHPRTAVAKLKDGRFLMITVDGRQPGVSVGMSLQELAEYLLSLGAVDAMNLDGGGSTTMFLNGKVVNTPSDKEGERKIGDAILVTLRKKARK